MGANPRSSQFKKKIQILKKKNSDLQQLLVALRVSEEKTLEQLRVRKKMTRVAPGRFGENSKQTSGKWGGAPKSNPKLTQDQNFSFFKFS